MKNYPNKFFQSLFIGVLVLLFVAQAPFFEYRQMPYVKKIIKKRTRNRVKSSNANLESNTQYAPFRKEEIKRFTTPVRIICTHYRARDFDLDNGSIKAVLDQIVRSGILADDSTKQIQEVTHRFVKSGEEKTIVQIQEI